MARMKSGVIYGVVALTVGLIVLAVSIMRTSFKIMAKDMDCNSFRIKPVYFKTDDQEAETYKLPEVGMLPDNPFYGFKKIRDYLWWITTRKEEKKAELALLLADKKMAEVLKLTANGATNKAIETAEEAVEKLMAADELAKDDQLKGKIYTAGLAYREIVSGFCGSFEIDETGYLELVDKLDRWNEEQKAKQKEIND